MTMPPNAQKPQSLWAFSWSYLLWGVAPYAVLILIKEYQLIAKAFCFDGYAQVIFIVMFLPLLGAACASVIVFLAKKAFLHALISGLLLYATGFVMYNYWHTYVQNNWIYEKQHIALLELKYYVSRDAFENCERLAENKVKICFKGGDQPDRNSYIVYDPYKKIASSRDERVSAWGVQASSPGNYWRLARSDLKVVHVDANFYYVEDLCPTCIVE